MKRTVSYGLGVALTLLILGSAQAQSMAPAAMPGSQMAPPGAPASPGQPVQSVPAGFSLQIVPMAPAPAPAQVSSGLADIIRAKFPLAIEYKDLGYGWRELEWGGSLEFTRGDTTWLNNVEYLVAYKPGIEDLSRLNTLDYIAAITNNDYPARPTDRYALTLLPMGDVLPMIVNGQTGIRSFDANRQRKPFSAANFTPAFNQALSLLFLQKIGAAINSYSQAYLGVMPSMESAFAAQQALLPFAENAAIFTQPGSDRAFKANPLFSQRKRAHLAGRERAVIFYEAEPAADGMRAILQYDGKVRRVNRKDWKELCPISGLDD